MRAIQKNGGSILMCVLEILLGVLLLIDPLGFTSAISIALGAALIVAGIVFIVRYFRAGAAQGALTHGLSKGLLLLLAGLFCVLRSKWFVATFPLLTILYGVGILISGVLAGLCGAHSFQSLYDNGNPLEFHGCCADC